MISRFVDSKCSPDSALQTAVPHRLTLTITPVKGQRFCYVGHFPMFYLGMDTRVGVRRTCWRRFFR